MRKYQKIAMTGLVIHVIPLDADTKMIALYRSPNCYDPMLENDDYSQWQKTEK